ncbi:1,2-dihydroxy-3-keto-5-methylthiopentene dioxygenase 1-like [Rhodamnia argentea]|uniref:Acireductone dioxygenase n=1 Tax=Rhodamnia argentea TaxID=178133 RepID=A0A8B8PFQ3_9MYRT|nr:1,2-dihydroxy-3-keto-5-methylthiopentene dioxygenase 1-like [Rhodamnia argentea]XP_048137233.1 1,2-dihydroxy-3-keto-5-methylthiopentene dioxygenase 1-like [Rhodamnia argentea]XP_048137234.1 1,2-dihydroxy-3-keto-5-methylthiopentene dioxygenase 1-like [Rhodamnia argentea]
MALEAWFMDDSDGDKRLPHHRSPPEFVSSDHLSDVGVLYWKLDPSDYENDEELRKIREDRGYNYMDLVDLCPEKVDDYEQKLKNFWTEHIHGDEEIRYFLEGSGYFDIRDKDDRWIRMWVKPGDLIVLPAGIYHRFTLDTSNYIKLMRLFIGEPVWASFNRPQEDHPARKQYTRSLTEKAGAALAAH